MANIKLAATSPPISSSIGFEQRSIQKYSTMIKKYTLTALFAIGFTSSVYAASIQVDDAEAIFDADEERIELFMTISNNGSSVDTLTEIKSKVAASAMINLVSMEEEDMVESMGEDVKGVSSLQIMPGQSLVHHEEGSHLMLVDTNTVFEEGETVRFTLLFENAGPIEVMAKVQAED